MFKNGKHIGGYERNYSSNPTETFYPFQYQDVWYALYSSNYTATRVARLEDKFEDWCGEERSAGGFCPVEFYVPRYNLYKSYYGSGEDKKEFVYDLFDNDCTEEGFFTKTDLQEEKYVGTYYMPYGFLCGCVWGDDSSWKLRYIDFSQLPNKKLIIESKFGYWEIPNDLKLRQCVKIMEHDDPWIQLTGMKTFHVPSGKDGETFDYKVDDVAQEKTPEINNE